MHSDRFEYEFSKFLDRHEYDEAENYLFSMVRLAFAAGWQAAGGEAPRTQPVGRIGEVPSDPPET